MSQRPPRAGPTPGRRTWPAPLTLGAVCLVVVALGSPVVTQVAIYAAIYAIAAIGLSVLSGTARFISLATPAFIGLGAFVANSLLVAGAQFPIAVLGGAAACMVLGAALSPVASRLAGIFLAILTVGVVLLAQHVFRVADGWTGGTAGTLVPPPVVAGLRLDRDTTIGGGWTLPADSVFFAFCAVLLVASAVTTTNLLRSRTGRALSTLASSPVTARSFGINPVRLRSTAFVYSSALAGASGALLAGYSGFISYDQFNVDLAVQLLAVVVLGGLGTVYGVVAAAAILFSVPELVLTVSDFIPLVAGAGGTEGLTPSQFSSVLYGLVLVVVVVTEPGGLTGLWHRLGKSRRARVTLRRGDRTC